MFKSCSAPPVFSRLRRRAKAARCIAGESIFGFPASLPVAVRNKLLACSSWLSSRRRCLCNSMASDPGDNQSTVATRVFTRRRCVPAAAEAALEMTLARLALRFSICLRAHSSVGVSIRAAPRPMRAPWPAPKPILAVTPVCIEELCFEINVSLISSPRTRPDTCFPMATKANVVAIHSRSCVIGRARGTTVPP